MRDTMNMTTHLTFIQSTPYGPGWALGAGKVYANSSWGDAVPGERSAKDGFGSGYPWPDIHATWASSGRGDGRGPATGQGNDRNGFGAGLE